MKMYFHRAFGFHLGARSLGYGSSPPYGWYLYLEVYYGRCARSICLWKHYYKVDEAH